MRMNKFQITTLFFLVLLAHVVGGIYFSGYTWWYVVICVIIYLTILVIGSTCIQYNFYLISINRLPLVQVKFDGSKFKIDAQEKRIALTFDDGPANFTEAILDILKKENIPATFFLIGKNIEGNEALLKRMIIEGHSIGNHSFHHGFNFDWKRSSKMAAEILETNTAIEAVTQIPTTLFRPPYGVTNPNLAKAIKKTGVKSIGWSLRSMDTVAKDPQKLLSKILNQVKSGDIILLHDSCAITLQILPQLLRSLKEKNFSFDKPN
jgi:peptidoglycan/xylan/chitin deacetylase (PgdA/CDA1 family)